MQKLESLILRFTSSKFQRSVNKHFKQFTEIGKSRATELGFKDIYKGIGIVHEYLNQGPFWAVLSAVVSEIDKKKSNLAKRNVPVTSRLYSVQPTLPAVFLE